MHRFVLTITLLAALLSLAACAPAPDAQPAPAATPAESAAAAPAASTLPTETAIPAAADAPAATEAPVSPAPFSAPVTARGEILLLTGRVLDVNGNPVPGAAVEIWQTDVAGIYDHPGQQGTADRDSGFQFYGSSTVDQAGGYSFRTILPGEYPGRPRHIHVKVRIDGREVLTTQFYFAEDNVTQGVGGSAENLWLTLTPAAQPDGSPAYATSFDIVIDMGIGSGALRLTDPQGEGPFYPVIDVSAFDNDLANVGN